MKSFYLWMVMMPLVFILMYGIVKFVVIVHVRMYTTKFLALASWTEEIWGDVEALRRDPSQKWFRLEESQEVEMTFEELYEQVSEFLEEAYAYYAEITRFDEKAIGYYDPTVDEELEKLKAIEDEIGSRLAFSKWKE